MSSSMSWSFFEEQFDEQEDFRGPVFDADSTQFRQNVSRGTFSMSISSVAFRGGERPRWDCRAGAVSQDENKLIN